ncbi:MAG: heavy metal-binding domain-containing protein [bacterium]
MKNKKRVFVLIILALLAAMGVVDWYAGHKASTGVSAKVSDYYYCPMHPWFHQDHPGHCGICGMTLILKKVGLGNAESSSASRAENKVKYWADPMNPANHYDHSGKAPCGMDLVAVYEKGNEPNDAGIPESLKGLAPVDLSPFQQQLIGLRTSLVEKKPIERVIRTVGRFAGGAGDFAAAAGDFAAEGKVVSNGRRYIVADVYALDFPYVKVGQKAWVSDFSGSGPRVEGRVTRIYPYDGTQSRLRRVKISLSQNPSSELFDNVEIEAVSPPGLTVPADAVMSTGLHHYVFVEKLPGIFTPREITVGFQGEDQWPVLSGLAEGETVVDSANFMLDSDSQIQANFADMEAQDSK